MPKKTKKEVKHKNDLMKNKCNNMNCSGGCGYFLGFIGAVVYYVSTANSFWVGFLGVLKALVWPAFLVYEVLKYIGA